MTELRTEQQQRTRRAWPEFFSALAGIAAIFSPATLTGLGPVDAVEKALIAVVVTFVGAHGRRWAWLLAAVGIVAPARGASLVLAAIGLSVIVAAAWPRRRPRALGALGVGILVNATFWYPPDSAPWGAVAAVAAFLILVVSGYPNVRRTRRRAVRIGLTTAALFTIIAGAALGVAMLLAAANVQSGGDAARAALDGARNGDATTAEAELTAARSSFERASSLVDGPLTVPALLVPGLSQQLQAVQTTVEQGLQISSTADDLIATADYDRLAYDGRLDLVQVANLAGPTRRADQALAEAQEELERVQDGFLFAPLRSRIDDLTGKIDEAQQDTQLASALLDATPGLFGADGERRYLVVFMTPAELRGAGGFVGSYGELVIDDGDVDLTRTGRIADLIFGPNQGSRTISGPPDYLRRYGRFHPEEFIQDATFSPNFPSSASVLAELYPQAGGSPVDGVIAVDPTGLAALLALTGPVTVDGLDEPLSAENAVEVLTRSQYLDLPDRAQRGEILTEATRATFEKLISSSLPAPRTLANSLSPATRAGHLRMWSPDATEQALFERLGADGTLVIPDGSDGFSVVQQNTGNNKLDAYLQRSITYLPTVKADSGELEATMRIELTNNVPSTNLPPAVVGNNRGLPVGTNLAWLTIYSPHAVTSATIDGDGVLLGPSSEEGLNAWDTPLLQIAPGATVVVELQLVGGVDLRDGYQLTILPQPVANPDRFTTTLTVANGEVSTTGAREAKLLDQQPVTAPTHFTVPIQE